MGREFEKLDRPEAPIRAAGAPPHDVTGTDALSPLLGRVTYPTTKEGILRSLGNVDVPINRDETRPLADILDEVAPESFHSNRDVEAAVQRVWDKVARREGRGGRQPKEDNLAARPVEQAHPEGNMPQTRNRKLNNADPRAARGK